MHLNSTSEVLFRVNPSQYSHFNFIQEKVEYLILVDLIYSSVCTMNQKDSWIKARTEFKTLSDILDQIQPEANPTSLQMVFEEFPISSYLKNSMTKCNEYEYELFKRLYELESNLYSSKLELASWEFGKQIGILEHEYLTKLNNYSTENVSSIFNSITSRIYGGPLNRNQFIIVRNSSDELIIDNYNCSINRIKNGDANVHSLINKYEICIIKAFLTIFNNKVNFQREIINHRFARDTFSL